MTPERLEELRSRIGLDPDEACEALERLVELEDLAQTASRVVRLHDSGMLASPGDSVSMNKLKEQLAHALA